MNFNVNGSSNTYDYMNSFFSGLNGTSGSNSSAGPSSLLGDWYSVQNGTYLKVAKKFYSSEAAKEIQSKDAVEKEMQMAKESAEATISSLGKLMDDDLYKKVSKTDEAGNKTLDYDKDAILKNVKTYIKDYNSLIENLGEMEDTTSLKTGVRLVKQADVYEGALARVGIKITSDNKLELDEEAFGKANMKEVESLFTGSVSYAKNMQTKVMQLYSQASNKMNSVNGLYSAGAKQISVDSMFDSML